MAKIYGKVEHPEDVRRINCIIRDEMLVVETVEQLTDLKKRSDYLCTLSYSPFWKKKFGPLVEQIREIALEENRITVRLANYISKYKNFEKEYSSWGKDNREIEEKLEELPKHVIEEIVEFGEKLELDSTILEDIRKSYCRIRAAMLLAKSEIQLTFLKKQADIIKAIAYTNEFKARFLEQYEEILEFIEKEEKRTVELSNIIAEVNNYFVSYEAWDGNFEEENLEEYIKNLLKEEEKGETYIPTEAKYNNGIVYWLVYKHPQKNRNYAKRIYFGGSVKDIQLEGPGEFENKFGKKVYGVKITYLTYVKPTVIHKKNIEIKLPERWVKRTKIVELPQGVEKVELVENRPDFAYPVA